MNQTFKKLFTSLLCAFLVVVPSVESALSWGGYELADLPNKKVTEIDGKLYVRLSKLKNNTNISLLERKMRLEAQSLLIEYCHSGNYNKTKTHESYMNAGTLKSFQLIERQMSQEYITHIYSALIME